MDPEVGNIMTLVVGIEDEQCFLCGKPLEIGCIYNKSTKLHLDNYEKYVQRHEVYKHIFNVRFMEYSNEGQMFSTCSGCFAGVDELLFINNQVEELENQLSLMVESLTTEILQNRNRYSETVVTDPLELDPLDMTPKTDYMTPLLANMAKVDVVTKLEVEIADQEDSFDFHCPTPHSPEDSWGMDSENETHQNLQISQPSTNNIISRENNEKEELNAVDLDLDIYSIMSSREVRIVLEKLDAKQIINYTQRTDTTSGLKVKNENVRRASRKIDDELSDWNSSADSAGEESDFEVDEQSKIKLKRGRRGRPKKLIEGSGRKRRELVEYFNCEVCGDEMKPMSKNEFRKHIQSHPKYKPFKCKFPNCEVKFRWSYALVIHEKEHVGSVDGFNCDICGNKYRGPYELRKHKQRVHVEGQEVCKICGNKYKLKQNLMVHVKRFHGISHLEYDDTNSAKQFCCDICQQSYSSENMLETHNLRFHSENVDFFCDFCNTNVTPVRSLTYINTSDKKLHTIGNIIKCTRKMCQERFNCTEKYRQHKQDHKLEGISNRPKKYKTKLSWKSTVKKPRSKEKSPRIARKLLGRKKKLKSEEELSGEVNSKKRKLENGEKPKEKRPRKKKLMDEIPAEDNSQIKNQLKRIGEENLINEMTGQEKMPEDCNSLNEIPEDFLSGNEMPDDDYQSERPDDSDWLSEEEKSKKKKTKRRKRKYKNNNDKVRGRPKQRPKEKKAVFKCEKCNEDFKKEVNFIKHNIEVHQQENSLLSFAEDQKKKLACGVCGKGFRKQANFARHLELHKKVKLSPEEKVKSLTCDICGKVCAQKFNLKIHKKIHSKEKLTPEEEAKRSVECKICGKILKCKSSLTQHLKNHFNVPLSVEEKLKVSKFKCEECGKPLTTMANLRRHLKQAHMEDRPFKCPQEGCSRTYKDEANLTKHLEGHLKVKEYDCDLCHKKFYRKDYLQLHFRRNHATTSRQYQTWKNKSLQNNSAPVGESVPASENVPGCDTVLATENFQ